MATIDSILNNGGSRYYFLTNADGKTWVLPRKNLATALELYQPGGIKGRLLKSLLPLVHPIPMARKAAKADSGEISLSEEIYRQAEKSFGTPGLEYSIFGGTPSVHQKITIQFFKGHRIYGYAKVTDSKEIASLFSNEERLLDRLHKAGIEEIPECLFNDTLSSGLHLFIQTTRKNDRSFSPSRWNHHHERFLSELRDKTAASYRFEDTDFARSLLDLKNDITFIPREFRATVSSALGSVLDSLEDKQVEYSAFHADFTPWNMFMHDGSLFVFDWEYGRMSFPPMLDRYHFFVQQAIHVRHLDADATTRWLRENKWFSAAELDWYLLDIISRFTLREKGAVSPGLYSMLRFWTGMLRLNSAKP